MKLSDQLHTVVSNIFGRPVGITGFEVDQNSGDVHFKGIYASHGHQVKFSINVSQQLVSHVEQEIESRAAAEKLAATKEGLRLMQEAQEQQRREEEAQAVAPE